MSDDIVSKFGFSDDFRHLYFDDDLNVKKCTVLFFLESPHTDEMANDTKRPVVGDSGVSMA